MIIYYNPAYSASPYRNEKSVEFGNIYCGDMQLLQKLLFYAGVYFNPVSEEERMAQYHSNMCAAIKEDPAFYVSFKIDSAGMSRAVLKWRDELVRVGWNAKKCSGSSMKLQLIKDVEPENMPLGEADYWNMLLRHAEEKRLLPEGFKVVVTCGRDEIKPHIAHILESQLEKGVSVNYIHIAGKMADGNLGKIQDALLSGTEDKIKLDGNDDTFRYLTFKTDDDVLRYVATEPVDNSAVYYCPKSKRFDNTLKLLGKPTIGSSLASGSPQVAQLFMLGNGLFEFPINMQRVIEWLNMPISPMDKKLRMALSNALINSGGINNEEWNRAIKDFLPVIPDTVNEDEKKKIEKQNKEILSQNMDFLPLPETADVDVKCVRKFNENLCKWATKLLAMEKFPYDEVVREQISSIKNNTFSLLKMLDNAQVGFKFLDLQLWCKNIAQQGVYPQYESELGSHNIIASMGDIHDVAERVVWFPAENENILSYPFDMLNDDEFKEVEKDGAKVYGRELHVKIQQSARLRMLLNTKRLTIIEAEKSGGEKVARHPFILQLDERIEGGLKGVAENPVLDDKYIVDDKQILNAGDNPMLVEIDKNVLKERHERYDDEEKKAESYSSLDQLIQHPFRYVCEKCARLDDKLMPSAQNLNQTLGNVAHLIIERVFGEKSIAEAKACIEKDYDSIFDTAVNEKGLLLNSPEYAIELRRLKFKMKDALNKLAAVIEKNSLIVEKCEHEFEPEKWKEAGVGPMLSSRADMLLNDGKGGKVIFDFKWSSGRNYYKSSIEENKSLQLELYRFMARLNYRVEKAKIRVAYILLPEVDVITADKFEGINALQSKVDRMKVDIMEEAACSYKFRWEQLKAGKIERVEGQPEGSGEYGSQTSDQGLFPLGASDKIYREDNFDIGYKNLK